METFSSQAIELLDDHVSDSERQPPVVHALGVEALRVNSVESKREVDFSDPEYRQIVKNLDTHFRREIIARNLPADLVSWNDLEEMLTPEEMSAVNYLRGMNPEKNIEKTAAVNEFVAVKDQSFSTEEGEVKTLPVKYLPLHIYEKFKALDERAQADGMEPFLIESGYRSPAYQAVVFLRFLSRNEFDFEKTSTRVALPGDSEHGSLSETAIDITTASFLRREMGGGVDPTEFDQEEAFGWLSENGAEFGFTLSYPKDNDAGIQYEPWHWRVREEAVFERVA